jgi:hypothetical protein
MQYRILLSFLLIYAVDGQAQKVCRQNYINEVSISYNNLMSSVFSSVGLSYELTMHSKKNKSNFVSLQLDYVSRVDIVEMSISNRIAARYLIPSLKYNWGYKHIYSVGLGVGMSNIHDFVLPSMLFNYKYDLRKQKCTVGIGLQAIFDGLAKTVEHYNPIPPKQITNIVWSPYTYSASWKDRILFNIRIGKYF